MKINLKDAAKFESIRLAAIIIVLLPVAAFVLGYFVFWQPLANISVWLAALLPICATLLLSFVAYKLLTSQLFEPLYNRGAHNLGKPIVPDEEQKSARTLTRLFRGRRRGPRR